MLYLQTEKLSEFHEFDKQKSLSFIFSLKIIRLIKSNLIFYLTQFNSYLLSDENLKKQ